MGGNLVGIPIVVLECGKRGESGVVLIGRRGCEQILLDKRGSGVWSALTDRHSLVWLSEFQISLPIYVKPYQLV